MKAPKLHERLLLLTALFFVATAGLAIYGVAAVVSLESSLEERLDAARSYHHGLAARASYDERRTSLRQGIGAAIHQFRPNVAIGDAHRFAEMVLDVADKYQGVDPLLLVSVGIVESGYDPNAISHVGARGLYQIYPPTGKVLAGRVGWEFSEELLHDPLRNTELAANYLELLGTTYNDVGMVLAEYNGGPINAGYFRAKADRLAEETKHYVPKVLDIYEKLGAELALDN